MQGELDSLKQIIQKHKMVAINNNDIKYNTHKKKTSWSKALVSIRDQKQEPAIQRHYRQDIGESGDNGWLTT